MEKEFVPYELAVKLKALGFDEPCFGYYDLDGLQINTHHWYPENKNSSFPLPNTTNNPKISAPTFSQAFKWYREKYGLSAIVSQFGYSIENAFGGIEYYIDENENPTCYEEAEIACLDKLIEMVKSKLE